MASLLLAAALSGCQWWEDKPIAIAAHVWPGYEPMFLAQSKGWLDRQKVHLVETVSATDSLRALVDGTVDGAALTLDEVLKARAIGIPLSVVMVFDVSAGADMLLVHSDIKGLAELKGLRVGFEQGAVGELMLDHVLQAAGLIKQDIKPISITTDQHLNAWNQNQVDAIITYEPVASQLLEQGAVRLFDSREIPNIIVDVLAIRGDVLNFNHAHAIHNLLDGYFRALEHLNRNAHDAAYHMANHLNLPADRVLSAFKGLVLPDATNNYRLLTGDSSEIHITAHKLSNIMMKNGLLPYEDNMSSLIRAEFLPIDYFQAN